MPEQFDLSDPVARTRQAIYGRRLERREYCRGQWDRRFPAPFTGREGKNTACVSGKSSIDLTDAVNQLGEHFGIRTLLLEGGGHINGAFLEADLIDEVSLLVVPGID